jgi:hypothetical protein
MDNLAVLAIPAVLVAGLVLVGLGVDGRARAAGSQQWAGRFQDWATQAGVRGVRLWQVVAVCGGAGVAVGVAVLALTSLLWLGVAFAGLAGWLPLGRGGAVSGSCGRSGRTPSTTWPRASGLACRCPRRSRAWPSAGRRRCERRSRALPTTTTPTAASAPPSTS